MVVCGPKFSFMARHQFNGHFSLKKIVKMLHVAPTCLKMGQPYF